MKRFIRRGNSSESSYNNEKDGSLFFGGDERGWLFFPAIVGVIILIITSKSRSFLFYFRAQNKWFSFSARTFTLKPDETNCDLWIRALQIKFD